MRILDNYDWHGKKKFRDLPDQFPNNLLDRAWVQKIHGQTLERRNERGGLSVFELLMNLKKLTFRQMREQNYSYDPTKKEVVELKSYLC